MKDEHTPGPFAAALSFAFAKYEAFFGEAPHGTEKQMAAMIELMQDKRFAAAPDMAEALKAVLFKIEQEGLDSSFNFVNEWMQARAALKKAGVK